MKKQLLGLSAAAVMATAAMPASADLMGVKGLSANVAYTSDYYFRGMSQNDHDPSFSAGIDYGHDSGMYVGAWAAVVDDAFYSGASKEVDVYFGWAGEVGGLGVDVGFLRYMYPGTTVGWNDTNEWHVGVSHDFGPAAASLTYNRSSDFFGFEEATYWDFGLEVPINDDWTAHAHYGITDYDEDKKVTKAGTADSYKDTSIGIATSLGPMGVDLTFTNTSDVAGGCNSQSVCNSRALLTLSMDL